jgi:2-oxoglutarate dehydrogenase E1 component
MRIALDFRQKYKKDVVLDVVGFRRLGHNEADEPSYTQPLMYQRVKEHPGVRTVYAKRLIKEGVIDEAGVNDLIAERVRRYEDAQERAKKVAAEQKSKGVTPEPEVAEIDGSEVIATPVTAEIVSQIAQQISVVPEGFSLNPKMVSQLARRAKMGEGTLAMDWAFAEGIAFGSLALEQTRVRLSGQDSGRGTFSQRHAVLYDTQTGKSWAPLSELQGENPRRRFEVFDSSLSEAGVLGFEYGYSVIAGDALVMWEAQFGDFNNVAQSIIDQYVAASEDKWKQTSRLTMLLPHGYEGQGPEHSSARLERFLQLCAANNLCVCYPSTPAQYFHVLRRQVREGFKRPLIVMTPKSLLRLPAATSSIEQLTSGGFQPVIDDAAAGDGNEIERLVFCSGKVFYDLMEARKKLQGSAGEQSVPGAAATASNGGPGNRVAVIRVEQFYPFPLSAVSDTIAKYPNVKELIWCQEEPKNMGAWTFMEGKFEDRVPGGDRLSYVGRAQSPSPATGSYAVHMKEQERLVTEALTIQ